MQHELSHMKRVIWRVIQRIDDANLSFLQVLPKDYKRAMVRRLLSILPKAYPDGMIEVAGVLFRLSGSDTAKLMYVTIQDGVAAYLRRHLAPGMTVIDVGANIGFHTVLAAKMVGPTGCVHAVEPTKETVVELRKNVQLNRLSNVMVYPCAAGTATGETTFYVRGGHGAQNSLFSDHLDRPVLSTHLVAIRRLDDLIQGPADIVKIDVEGGELEVLMGMERIRAENPKLRMVLEWCPVMQENTGHGPTQLPETLLALGFEVDIISPFTAPLRSVADIHAILPKVIGQRAHMVDIAAARG